MCHATFKHYTQCGDTVQGGMDVCPGDGPKGTTCPNYTTGTVNEAGECPECVYGTPTSIAGRPVIG